MPARSVAGHGICGVYRKAARAESADNNQIDVSLELGQEPQTAEAAVPSQSCR
ncbi:uncharacterized protein METZ01_LOCUS135580 [marine metagenome]|uniref:Uncharacterized protein n=1 Tax=marine metagenome TaxID=408172 RepID=A0A381Z0A0_9ZZZZ